MKVILIIGIEMLVFPLYCGLLLDIALLPLFENTTLKSRLLFSINYPLTSIFVHWFVGTGYMFHFALFVSMCRKIMRKGVLYFIRRPGRPRVPSCARCAGAQRHDPAAQDSLLRIRVRSSGYHLPWWCRLGIVVRPAHRLADTLLVVERTGARVSHRPALLQLPHASSRQVLQAQPWPPCHVYVVVPEVRQGSSDHLVPIRRPED